MNTDQRGSLNSNWKGGRINKDGYIMVYAPEHLNANKRGYVYEHRLVMSGLINRPLYPDEVVHHIDGNRSNNDPSNLMLEHIGPHLALHNFGSKKFTDKQLAEIKKDYMAGCSASVISKKYKCSAGTIAKWLKRMGLEIRNPGFYAKKRVGRSKLTDDQWKELYADYASGMFFIKDLVKKYGISQAMIPRGLKARGYKIRQLGGGCKPKKKLAI